MFVLIVDELLNQKKKIILGGDAPTAKNLFVLSVAIIGLCISKASTLKTMLKR